MLRVLKADGTCYIQPSLLHKDQVAHVKPSDAGIAAAYIIRRCVDGSPPQGGAASNIGRWQALALRHGRSSIFDNERLSRKHQ